LALNREEWRKLLKKEGPTQGCRASDDGDDDYDDGYDYNDDDRKILENTIVR
jgi:hypothetical protein